MKQCKVPFLISSYLRRYYFLFFITNNWRYEYLFYSFTLFYFFIWWTLFLYCSCYFCLRLPRFPCHLDQSKFSIIFTPRVRPGTISGSMNQSNFVSNIIYVYAHASSASRPPTGRTILTSPSVAFTNGSAFGELLFLLLAFNYYLVSYLHTYLILYHGRYHACM